MPLFLTQLQPKSFYFVLKGVETCSILYQVFTKRETQTVIISSGHEIMGNIYCRDTDKAKPHVSAVGKG